MTSQEISGVVYHPYDAEKIMEDVATVRNDIGLNYAGAIEALERLLSLAERVAKSPTVAAEDDSDEGVSCLHAYNLPLDWIGQRVALVNLEQAP